MFYIVITRHKHDVPTTFAIWALPIVPTIVAGVSGCIVARALMPVNLHHAFLTTLVSAASLSMGLSMALVILVLYVQRLILHGFPAESTAFSILLPLGILGQGGYGFLLAANLLVELLPEATSSDNYLANPGVAQALEAFLFANAVGLWLFGIWFLVPAVLRLATTRGLPFGLAWWGMIFPSGTYALLTLEIGQKLHSSFVNVIGAIYSICIFILFTAISIRTVVALRQGLMFDAPCLRGPIMTKLGLIEVEEPKLSAATTVIGDVEEGRGPAERAMEEV